MHRPTETPTATPPDDFEAQATALCRDLYCGALRMTRDPDDAQDLVQDTYVRALRFSDHFLPGTNLRAWLFKILTNTFINRYRRCVRERDTLRDHGVDDGFNGRFLSASGLRALSASAVDTDLELFSDEVVAALDKVPGDFRTVLLLADLHDCSYKEIAEIVGCPIGTVMSRLFRGRRIMQRELRRYATDEGVLRPAADAPASVARPTSRPRRRTARPGAVAA
jgi:RNA polymerase sigma-70 factor (ECF subfamily)